MLTLFVSYVLVRGLSLLTYTLLANEILAGLAIIVFTLICFKNQRQAWFILLFELFLGGAGHFFEFQGLILRTWFLGIFAAVWLGQKKGKMNFKVLPKEQLLFLSCTGIIIVFSLFHGFISGHTKLAALQDAIAFGFFALLFPALDYKYEVNKIITAGKTWILGSTFFSLLTLGLYASKIGTLPDFYYHWFRNSAGGKITDLGHNFFRVVLSEQTLLIPIIAILIAWLIYKPTEKKNWLWLGLSLTTLALNFSRIYLLSLAAIIIVLGFKAPLKQWLKVSTITVIGWTLIFTSLNIIVSRGGSTGLELLGVRALGTAAPTSDVSGAIRLAILPDALRQIKTNPWFGTGLGATITYVDPVTQQSVTRTQFDWGYLEMLAELGSLGTVIWLGSLGYALFPLARAAYQKTAPLERGLLAGIISLGIINLTTPALFQGFGVLFFVFTFVAINYVSLQSPAAPPHSV